MVKLYVLTKVDPITSQPYEVVHAFRSAHRAFAFLKNLHGDDIYILNTQGIWVTMYMYHSSNTTRRMFIHEDETFRLQVKGRDSIAYRIQIFED